ncbi:hypothetical protein E2P81_ATG02033 [Venturia nashicola]|uniref:Secreted protein n=1 Tax=Venturia nashicola TaxID=86259 RepID=A0A4Z1PKK4_9PEZI|nr:hypothetical protein E6O75_ATG02076 [Venturia nashicola]TLD35730.1 hypothetical protein E2P81_ATG02033 [Venturia nashicola]
MKISVALTTILLAITSVSADKHDYCCCSKDGGCLSSETGQVQANHKTGGVWNIAQDKFTTENGAPWNCENCWLYALKNGLTGKRGEDGKIGGEQMANECKLHNKAKSTCWNYHDKKPPKKRPQGSNPYHLPDPHKRR